MMLTDNEITCDPFPTQAMHISICFIGNRKEEDKEETKKKHIQGKIFCTDIKNYMVTNKS